MKQNSIGRLMDKVYKEGVQLPETKVRIRKYL